MLGSDKTRIYNIVNTISIYFPIITYIVLKLHMSMIILMIFWFLLINGSILGHRILIMIHVTYRGFLEFIYDFFKESRI